MKSLVLYFFLLILGVLFKLILDIVHKCSRFSKTLSEKGLKFVLSKGRGPVTFDSGFMLLSAKIDLISKKRICKRDAFVVFSSSGFKIVLALLTKGVTFHIQVSKL